MASTRQPFISEVSRRRKLQVLTRYLPPEATVLEVGAGSGWFSAQLRQRGYRVTTLDIVPPADIVGDITRWDALGIPAGAFDAVVALEVIEHIDCLAALRAVCKPGGLIMLSSPHPQWDWVMQFLERIGLTQPRTSPHSNLTDFRTIPLNVVLSTRPLYIHQVAIFRNETV